MTTIRRWSPSRISDALSCGRRLQAHLEKWERGPDQIGAVRGRVVHQVLADWETKSRELDLADAVTKVWSSLTVSTQLQGLIAGAGETLDLAAKLAAVEDEIAADIATRGYQRPKTTKEFKERTAKIAPERGYVDQLRSDLAAQELLLAGEGLIPWQMKRSFLEEGFFHSFETVRRGTAFVAALYPNPDVVGLEWELEAALGDYELHGFLDRVELAADGIEVVDYKSSQYEETPLDHFVQAASYVHLCQQRTGLEPERVRFVYLRDQKTVAYQVRADWSARLVALVAQADARAASRSFAPSFSGCGICPWRHVCEAEFQMTPIEEGEQAA